MAKGTKALTLIEEKILNKIYLVRGKKVMLDFDLSVMYNVETKQLKRQVRRNIERFPSDFMFELTERELENLRSQIGTSSWGGARYLPMAFTEQGVAMLSSVLNSKTAIKVNIQIIRVFSKIRELMFTHKNILIKIEQIQKRMIKQDGRLKKNEEDICAIFDALKELLNPPQEPRRRIGFRRKDEEN
jgi:hypothetical protein